MSFSLNIVYLVAGCEVGLLDLWDLEDFDLIEGVNSKV